MNKQKGLAPILIVLLIALAVGGYLVYQQQSKPIPQSVTKSLPSPVTTQTASNSAETANWKTYTNIDGKYTLQYPADYILKEADEIKTAEKFSAGKKLVSVEPSDRLAPKSNFVIFISYYPISDLSQVSEVMKQISGCDAANAKRDKYAPQEKDFTIDNQKAVLYEDSLCAQSTAANFYILHDKRAYAILVASAEKYSLHKVTVDRILSTFKFTQ